MVEAGASVGHVMLWAGGEVTRLELQAIHFVSVDRQSTVCGRVCVYSACKVIFAIIMPATLRACKRVCDWSEF